MRNEFWVVACPKCGAGTNERCRTLTTNRVTDTHVARVDAYVQFRHRRTS